MPKSTDFVERVIDGLEREGDSTINAYIK